MNKRKLVLIGAFIALGSLMPASQAHSDDNSISRTERSLLTAEDEARFEERSRVRKKLIFQAYKRREDGKNKQASELFWKVLRDYEDPIGSALPLTEIMMEQGDYKGAVDIYRHMIPEQFWNGAGSSRWIAIDTVMRFVFALSVTGHKGEAWDVFQDNVKQIPEDLLPLFEPYAEGLRDRAHYNDVTLRAIAMTVFGYTYPGKVIKPNEDQTLFADKSPDAIAAYTLALKYSPRFAPAHYFLASTLKDKGNRAVAKEEWEKAKQYTRDPKLQAMIREKDYLYKTP